MSRQVVRTVALVAMLVLAVASTGLASADHHETHSAHSETHGVKTELATHTHVHMHAAENGLVLEVRYEGNGSALVTVEGTDASYADAGTYEVRDERTFHLAVPERPSGIRVTIETSRGEFVRTVEFERVQLGCGDTTEPIQIPTRVITAWTVEYAGEERSDRRAHDLPTPRNAPCPELPGPGDVDWADRDPPATTNGTGVDLDTINEAFDDHEADIFGEAGSDRPQNRSVDPSTWALLHATPADLAAGEQAPRIAADIEASAGLSVTGLGATASVSGASSTTVATDGNVETNATAAAGE